VTHLIISDIPSGTHLAILGASERKGFYRSLPTEADLCKGPSGIGSPLKC